MYIIPQMKLLTTTEAAARLNISTRRVRALIAKGRLPAYLHGRDWLISERSLKLVAVRKMRSDAARCPCDAMTERLAKIRGHRCAVTATSPTS